MKNGGVFIGDGLEAVSRVAGAWGALRVRRCGVGTCVCVGRMTKSIPVSWSSSSRSRDVGVHVGYCWGLGCRSDCGVNAGAVDEIDRLVVVSAADAAEAGVCWVALVGESTLSWGVDGTLRVPGAPTVGEELCSRLRAVVASSSVQWSASDLESRADGEGGGRCSPECWKMSVVGIPEVGEYWPSRPGPDSASTEPSPRRGRHGVSAMEKS